MIEFIAMAKLFFGGVLNFLKGLPPAVWYGIAAIVVCFACVKVGEHRVQVKWDAQTAQIAAHAAAVKTEQSGITGAVDQKVAAGAEQIKTVFKDRIIYRDKQVTHETVAKEDAACIIPNRFVSLWNSANRGVLPDPASVTDEAASDVRLSDVSDQHEREAEVNRLNVEQIKGWQDWAAKQGAIK